VFNKEVEDFGASGIEEDTGIDVTFRLELFGVGFCGRSVDLVVNGGWTTEA